MQTDLENCHPNLPIVNVFIYLLFIYCLFITPPQDNKWEQLRNKEKKGNIVELENKKEATQ